MPLPIQADRATLVIDGTTYELRNVHVRTEFEQEFTPVMGLRGVVGRALADSTERVTIEAEAAPVPIGRVMPDNRGPIRGPVFDAVVQAAAERIQRDQDRAVTSRLETGLRGPAKATTPKPEPPKSRYERLLAEDDLV